MKEQDNIRTRQCPDCYLCGAPGRPLYQGLKDRLFGVPGIWNLKQCTDPDCSLVWLDPMPVEEDIGRLYTNYFTHVPDVSAKKQRNLKSRLKDATLAYAFDYPERIPEGWVRVFGKMMSKSHLIQERLGHDIMWLNGRWRGRLLDIGCGNGRFLAQMRKLGWDCVGFEPDPVAAEVALKRHRLEVFHGVLEEAGLQKRSFDVITMAHVIEHLPDRSRTLKICHQLLKENGLVVIATPNISSLGHRMFKSAYVHLDPPRHLYIFSLGSLCNCVNSSGFEVKKVWTSANSAPAMWARSRLIKKEGFCSFDLTDLPHRYTKVEGNLFWAVEHMATKLLPLGEELVLIAKKR